MALQQAKVGRYGSQHILRRELDKGKSDTLDKGDERRLFNEALVYRAGKADALSIFRAQSPLVHVYIVRHFTLRCVALSHVCEWHRTCLCDERSVYLIDAAGRIKELLAQEASCAHSRMTGKGNLGIGQENVNFPLCVVPDFLGLMKD